jgi:NhaP-type Na+/H+ or K+/H+ antiporter
VIFGFTIVLASLLDLKVWLVSILILGILYGVRWTWFRFVIRRDIYPLVWMAPRGLITILLFYSIPESLLVEEFNMGILLLVILASSILMAISLIKYRKSKALEPELEAADDTNEALSDSQTDNQALSDSTEDELPEKDTP